MRRINSLALAIFLASCGGGGSQAPATSDGVAVVPVGTPTAVPTPAPTPSASLDAVTLPMQPGAIQVVFGAGDLPTRATPYIVGVAAHFAFADQAGYDPAKSVARMAESNVQSFRDDIFWNAFAPNWDINGSHLTAALTSALKLTSARPLMIINNGNSAVPEGDPPVTDRGRTAFADFATRAVTATVASNPIYEIWNEWNMNAADSASRLTGTGDAGDYRASLYYAPLATKAVAAIKARYPRSPVLVGASGDDIDWLWTRDVIARGALRQADGLSVHLYNHCGAVATRTAGELIGRLTTLHNGVAALNGGTDAPIYVTEWGWPGGTNTCSVAEDTRATNIPQFLLHSAALPWVAGSWLYELKNSGSDASDIQDNFGLYDNNFNAKASQCTFADAAKLIAGSKAMAVQVIDGDLTLVRVATATGLQVIAWSTNPARTAKITVGGTAPFAARRMCKIDDSVTSGRTVSIGAMPVVIDVPGVAQLAVNAGFY